MALWSYTLVWNWNLGAEVKPGEAFIVDQLEVFGAYIHITQVRIFFSWLLFNSIVVLCWNKIF